MKKCLALVLALALAIGLAACSGDTTSDPSSTASTPTTEATEPTTTEATEPLPTEADGATVVMQLNCDSADGWQTDNAGEFGDFLESGKLDTENMQEGTGCLSVSGNDNKPGTFLSPSATFMWTGVPVDTGLTQENGAIRMWIYVSDPAAVGVASKVQIGSAGAPDVDNYEFIFGNSDDQSVCTHAGILTEGWNEITLNLSDAYKVGNPDLSAINFIKFYALIMPADVTVKIDDVRLIQLP